jgi:plastocyanin
MRKLLVLLSVIAVLGAGCGSDSSESSDDDLAPSDSPPPVQLAGTTNNHGLEDVTGKGDAEVDVEVDSFYFGPTFVKAKAGQSLSFKLKNESSAPHTFTTASGIDEQLSPSDAKTVKVTVASSGVLVFYCRFHQSQGMQGAVYLNEGDAVSTTPTSGAGGYGY